MKVGIKHWNFLGGKAYGVKVPGARVSRQIAIGGILPAFIGPKTCVIVNKIHSECTVDSRNARLSKQGHSPHHSDLNISTVSFMKSPRFIVCTRFRSNTVRMLVRKPPSCLNA